MLNAILYVLESNRFSAQGIESSGVYNCRKKKKKKKKKILIFFGSRIG